ncbi:MAG: oxidoreductase C-terminal domain-containing protein, partial [Planctomycetota bacterium]
ARATSPQVSAYFHDLHRAHGVDLRLGRTVQQIDPTDAGLTLRGAGFAEEVDFAVIGIGASPNVALAEQCGLEIDNGIVVDEAAQTSDSSVLAVGDCCNQHHAHYDRRVRLESVQNANDSAKLAAATIAGKPTPGKPTPGMTIPWFWSDQYETKLQIVGLADGCDACVLRGKPEFGHSFSAWYLRDGELRAVDAINDGKAYIIGGKLIPRRVKPDLDVIADPQSNLKQLLTA